MSGTWLAAYAGYDNEVLTSIANAGLVRRAVKLLEAQLSLEEDGTDYGVVKVGDFSVRLDGRGPAQARCPCPSAGSCTHILAAAMFARQQALQGGHTPEQVAELAPPKKPAKTSKPVEESLTATSEQLALLNQLTRALESAVSGGLSHLGADTKEHWTELALAARSGGMPLLSRMLHTLAAQLGAVAGHSDDVSELEATSTIAGAWALSKALEQADANNWARLRGSLRKTFIAEETKQLDLLPIGANWWVSDSGARGVTLMLWDRESAEVRTTTTARPAGTDPSFHQASGGFAFWNTPLRTLTNGPFQLVAPKLSDDGKLSPSSGKVSGLATSKTEKKTAFSENELQAIANTLRPDTSKADFTGTDSPVALVRIRAFGTLDIDEPNQCLIWSLPVELPEDSGLETALASTAATDNGSIFKRIFAKDSGAILQLQQESTAATATRIDNILALEAKNSDLAFVLIRHFAGRWEPLTVFIRTNEGLEPVLLDFDKITQPSGLLSMLQRRWKLWLTRSAESRPLAPPRPTIEILCDDIRELVVEATATGRSQFSNTQQQRCQELAARCDLLALSTTAVALRNLEKNFTAGQLLLVFFLADRVAGLQPTN